MEQQLTWEPEKPRPGKLIFSLTVPGRLPSWNDILGMEHWARHKFKKELANEFLSELRALERGSSTKTTSAKSTTLTFADTLALYLATKQEQRASRQRSVRRKKAKKNTR